MKCPWKEHIHIKKDGMGHMYRDVEWDECYKDECPFFSVNSYTYSVAKDGETEVMKDGRCGRVEI